MIPLDELVRDFRVLARQFPMSAKPTDDWSQVLAHARSILDGLPKAPEIYYHGANGKACPCASCCGDAYRHNGPFIEDALRTKPNKRRRSVA
jgi:hypothetical protein